MAITWIVVTGSFTASEGGPASGQVTFQLSAPIHDSSGTYIANDVVPIALVSGAFSESFPANNDATTIPTGTTYTISFNIEGQTWVVRNVVLPHNAAGGTIDISDLAPA